MVLAGKIIGWILVVVGAVIVYGAKPIIRRRDSAFDLEGNADYSYRKLAKYKIIGFCITLVGIILVLTLMSLF